jgi:hypothetical protein
MRDCGSCDLGSIPNPFYRRLLWKKATRVVFRQEIAFRKGLGLTPKHEGRRRTSQRAHSFISFPGYNFMAGIMPLRKVKERIKYLTEASPICIVQKDGENGLTEFYPYVKLPLESRVEYVPMCNQAICHLYDVVIGGKRIKVTSLLHPEAKAFPLITAAHEHTGIGGPVPRKKEYGVPGEVKIEGETAYGKGNMYFTLENWDTDLLIWEGIMSSGKTIIQFIKSLEDPRGIAGKRRNVVGGIAIWERGNGLYKLKEEYLDKAFAAFMRLEIVPREGMINKLRSELGSDISPESYLGHLLDKVSKEEFQKRRSEFFNSLNERFHPNVPYFFDEIR